MKKPTLSGIGEYKLTIMKLLEDSGRSSSKSDILVEINEGYRLGDEKNISGRNTEKEMFSINEQYSGFDKSEN